MRLTETDYGEVRDLVAAYANLDLRDKEKAQIQTIVNRAARKIYDETPFWPRFLVVGEPRPVARGYVEYELDALHVFGAGTSETNGLYERNGTVNAKPRYSKFANNGVAVEWDAEYDGAAYQILAGADNETYAEDTVFYANNSADPEGVWGNVDQGESPAPEVRATRDIDEIFRINRQTPYAGDATFEEYAHVPDAYGARIINEIRGEKRVVHVTYKASLNDKYGDGTNGTVSQVPSEWVDFISLFAGRQMQIAQRQINPNGLYQSIAVKEVEDARMAALERIDRQHIYDHIGKRITTHTKGAQTL